MADAPPPDAEQVPPHVARLRVAQLVSHYPYEWAAWLVVMAEFDRRATDLAAFESAAQLLGEKAAARRVEIERLEQRWDVTHGHLLAAEATVGRLEEELVAARSETDCVRRMSRQRAVFICGGDMTPGPRGTDCPNPLHDHPLPSGYLEAHTEANSRLHRGWQNSRCPQCGLYGWAPGRTIGATDV